MRARISSMPLSTTLLNGCKNVRSRLGPRLRAEVAFAMNADAHGVGFHVALSNHEHGVDLHLFSTLDFAVDVVAALVDLGSDLMGAQLI